MDKVERPSVEIEHSGYMNKGGCSYGGLKERTIAFGSMCATERVGESMS